MSVFISWRGSDREIKNQIVSALRESLPKEKIWESDEDCLSNFSQECIENVRKCEVFVAIISDASMEPSYMLNEIIEARNCEKRGTLNLVVFKITDSEYTADFAANLNHISDVNQKARTEGTDDGIQALVNRVKQLLVRRRSNNPEKPYDVFIPEIAGTKIVKSGYFVPESRDDIFDSLDEAFTRSNVVFVTHMNGYGRKSAIRKYSEQRSKDYDTILFLHLFQGSLREFFTDGLQITNINQKLFEDINENQHILRKSELLKKLNTKTLLIVPNLTIDSRDDSFIFDLLAELPCRVIFIAQTLPTRMSGMFPIITVGRLQERYLKELFFHYYDLASPTEQNELDKDLIHFFNQVDGHTKSVEITAMTIADEIGVYPEDLKQVLESIHPNSENELSDRIFHLISDLFNMRNFSEEEQNILLVSALSLAHPMDEKEFVELLKVCEVYQSSMVRKLVENHWLNLDRESRTVSMEPLMINVCLSKIPMNNAILDQLIQHLTEEISFKFFYREHAAAKTLLKRILYLFNQLKLSACTELVRAFLGNMTDINNTTDIDYFNRLTAAAHNEANIIHYIEIKESLQELIKILSALSYPICVLSEDTGAAIDNREKSILDKMLEELATLLEAFQEEPHSSFIQLVNQFIHAIYDANQNQIVVIYLYFCEHLLKLKEELNHIDENEEILLELVLSLGSSLITIHTNNSYLRYRLCRAYNEIRRITGGYISGAELFTMSTQYFYSMIDLGIADEELTEAFEDALFFAVKEENAIFENRKASDTAINVLICHYSEAMAEAGKLSEAAEAYWKIEDLATMSAEIAHKRVLTIKTIANGFIAAGKVQFAISFLSDSLTYELNNSLDNEEDRELFSCLAQTLNYLRNPDTDHGFADSYTEFFDYYKSFAADGGNKRAYREYLEIAQAAQELDYSSLTNMQLAKMISDIKVQAQKNDNWQSFAPQVFALVSEAGFRILGYRHHYVQYVGAAAIADGKIAEIQNGEGKTYTIILAAALHSVLGRKVHIVDAFPYLTERNYTWMRGVLELLGFSVGLLAPNYVSPDCSLEHYGEYDILYTSLESVIFFREREEVANRVPVLKQEVAIVDEADYMLVDIGSQTFILSRNGGEASFDTMENIFLFLSSLGPYDSELFEIVDNVPVIKPKLRDIIESQLGFFYDNSSEELADELIRICLYCLYIYKKGSDYYIIDGEVFFENKTLGTFYTPNSNYTYFLCRKENLSTDPIKKKQKSIIINQYIPLEFMSRYEYLAGTTATARHFEKEFKELYGLEVIGIPTNVPIARVNYQPMVFAKEETKLEYILELVSSKHQKGQPVLVIAGSVGESETIYATLCDRGISATLLNAKNQDEEAQILGEAGCLGKVTVATALANRGVDILLGGNPFDAARRHLLKAGVDKDALNNAIYRPNKNDCDEMLLRDNYDRLVSYYKGVMNPEKKCIEDLGGLCVIGSKCFDSLAVEQQVRGRAGRQGAKGESYLCYSLSDPGLRKLFGDRYQSMVAMYARMNIEVLDSKFLFNTIYSCRKNLQTRNHKCLLDTPHMLYFQFAREQILGLKEQICKRQLSLEQLLEKYSCFNRAHYMECLNNIYAKQQTLPVALRDNYIHFIQHFLSLAWEEYLIVMQAEISKAERLWDDKKKQQKHLTAFSKSCSSRLITEAIQKMVDRFLNYQPK